MRISQKAWFLFFCLSITPFLEAHGAQDSVWATEPPVLDGATQADNWAPALENSLKLDHGLMLTQNDATTLYILLDMIGDTHDDQPDNQPPWFDTFLLAFDLNRDGEITPNVDVFYTLHPSAGNEIALRWYLDRGRSSDLRRTAARLAVGFGRSMRSAVPHRVWEMAIPLEEIQARPGGSVMMGIANRSRDPRFSDYYPVGFRFARSFRDLLEVRLSRPDGRAADAVVLGERLRRDRIRDDLAEVRPLDDIRRTREPREPRGPFGVARKEFAIGSGYREKTAANYRFVPEKPGFLRLEAAWQGTAEELSLILSYGPTESRRVERRDGKSPLEMEFDITESLLQNQEAWNISILNPDDANSAVGTLVVEAPVEPVGLDSLSPQDRERMGIQDVVPGQPTSGMTERKILGDGTIEVRYTDGAVKRFGPRGEVVQINPDGMVIPPPYVKQIILMMNVAPLPNDDPAMNAWLEQICQDLLEVMRGVLYSGSEKEKVDKYIEDYVESEISKDLPQLINSRMEDIKFLLGTSAE